MDLTQIGKIKEITQEFFKKMSAGDFELEINIEKVTDKNDRDKFQDVVNLDLNFKEPQFLIGKDGQTLLDLQKILRAILNKSLQQYFYVKIDINNYQKQKTEHLKKMAQSLADEVVLSKTKKSLPPMSSYERRVVHEELSKREDVVSQSEGEGLERRISIAPK